MNNLASLPVGTAITDGGSGVGTIFEKKLEWCTILWSAPKAGSISAVDYDDPQVLSRWTAGSSLLVYGASLMWQIMPDGHLHLSVTGNTNATGPLYATSSVDGVAQPQAQVSIDPGLTPDGLLQTYIYGLLGFPPWNYVFTYPVSGTADVWPEATHTKKFTAFSFSAILSRANDGCQYGDYNAITGAIHPLALSSPTTLIAGKLDPWGNPWVNLRWTYIQAGDHIKLNDSGSTTYQDWRATGPTVVFADHYEVPVTGSLFTVPPGGLINCTQEYYH